MTDKEVRRMRRKDLLEALIAQTKRADSLRAQLDEAQAQLNSRQITIENAGSIAEAALQLSGVFAAAEAAGQLYLENLQARAAQSEDTQLLADVETRCRVMEAEAEARCHAMEQETESRCKAALADAQARCNEKISNAQREANAYWEDLYIRLEQFYDSHRGMRQMLERNQAEHLRDDCYEE